MNTENTTILSKSNVNIFADLDLTNLNLTDNDFKPGLSNREYNKIFRDILTFFFNKTVITNKGKMFYICDEKTLRDVFGLWFTSSSAYAMVTVCNPNDIEFVAGFRVHHFAYTKTGRLIMVCTDRNENYIYLRMF